MSVQHGDTRASPAFTEENQCSRDQRVRPARQSRRARGRVHHGHRVRPGDRDGQPADVGAGEAERNSEPDFAPGEPGGVPVGSDQRGHHVRHPCRGGVLRHRRSLQQAAGTTRTGRGADPPSEEVTLLTEIRDELRARSEAPPASEPPATRTERGHPLLAALVASRGTQPWCGGTCWRSQSSSPAPPRDDALPPSVGTLVAGALGQRVTEDRGYPAPSLGLLLPLLAVLAHRLTLVSTPAPAARTRRSAPYEVPNRSGCGSVPSSPGATASAARPACRSAAEGPGP